MDRELVGEIPPFRNSHGVDITDQVSNRGVRCCEFLGIAALTADPRYRRFLSGLGNPFLTGGAGGMEGVIIDLAAFDDRCFVIEKLDQVSDDASLSLASFAKKDEVMTCDDSPFQSRNDAVVVTDYRRKYRVIVGEALQEVVAEFLLDALGDMS
jgi:hypothetical protein